MPFPNQHLLLSPIGDSFGGTEQWTFTLRVDRSDLPSEQQMEDLFGVYSTYHTSALTFFAGPFRLLGLKAAPIGTDGKYPAGADAVEYVAPTPIGGGSGAATFIPQATCAVSLVTALSRGRGYRGRFYPPSQVFTMGDDGRILATKATDYATAAAALIEGIQNILTAPVVVGSELAGTLRPVTGVEVGRVVDTQRRRRRSLDEEWVAVPVDPTAGA